MPHTIVVGFDGSDHATDALALGRLLARMAGAELVVACAYPDDPLGESAAAVEVARGMREDAEGHLARARVLAGADDGVAFRAVAGSSPSQVLHALADELGADAIVVGPTHHGTVLRRLTGSTPEHVLDHSPCPVAVAPEGYAGRAGEVRKITVAWDDSPEAAHALAVAADLARRSGARLRLVTAVSAASAGLYPPLDSDAYEELARLAREEAERRLDAAIAPLEGVTAERAVLEGDPLDTLLHDTATDDLLFTGSRGRGPVRRVLLGSVSSHLLREAACPVVVVPRGEGDDET